MPDAASDNLIAACVAGDESRIRALLVSHPELLREPNMFGVLPIHAAFYSHNPAALDLLFAVGIEVDYFLAAELNDVERVSAALKREPTFPLLHDSRGMTALHQSCYWGAIDVARILVQHGADVTAASRDEFLQIHPLGSAVAMTPGVPNPSDDEDRVLAMVDLLLNNGADVNARRRDGLTALHTAAYQGQTKVIRRLMDRGADVRMRGHEGEGPHGGQAARDIALARGHIEAVAQLGAV